MYRIVDRGEYIAALSVQPSENQKANNREELIVAAAGRSARGMGTRAAIIDASPIPDQILKAGLYFRFVKLSTPGCVFEWRLSIMEQPELLRRRCVYYMPHLFWAENGAAEAAHTIHDHLSGGPQWQG